MDIKYFSWIREGVGSAGEQLSKPESVSTVHDLLDHLSGLSDEHARVLGERVFVRVAINQTHVTHDHIVADNDEVAIFPPVTGG